MKRVALLKLLPFIIALPAILIGSFAMYKNNIPMTIWLQNIISLLVIGIFINLLPSRKPKIIESFTIPIIVALILTTFLDPGLASVHRWITIGPVKLYISSIVIPILLIELWRISQTLKWWFPAVITIGVSILLALQPDASQITAFTLPMVVILWNKAQKSYVRYSVLTVLFFLIVLSWIFLDTLPPVAYVEGIVKMVGNLGILWFGLAIISLAILPLPFILFAPRNAKLCSICLGSYFLLILISTIFGNFPVPLMGYGISPILGYYLAVNWLIRTQKIH